MSPATPRPIRRRTPRLVPFLATGAILGFVAGALVAILGSPVPSYSANSQLGYFGSIGLVLGALVAALAYLVADRRT